MNRVFFAILALAPLCNTSVAKASGVAHGAAAVDDWERPVSPPPEDDPQTPQPGQEVEGTAPANEARSDTGDQSAGDEETKRAVTPPKKKKKKKDDPVMRLVEDASSVAIGTCIGGSIGFIPAICLGCLTIQAYGVGGLCGCPTMGIGGLVGAALGAQNVSTDPGFFSSSVFIPALVGGFIAGMAAISGLSMAVIVGIPAGPVGGIIAGVVGAGAGMLLAMVGAGATYVAVNSMSAGAGEGEAQEQDEEQE